MKNLTTLLFIIVFSNLCLAQRFVKFGKNEYNIGVIAKHDSLKALCADRILIDVHYCYFTHISEVVVPEIDQQLGPNYTKTLIAPVMRSIVRETVGKYNIEQITTHKREELNKEIFEKAASTIKKYKIYLKDAMISEIILPPEIKAAFNNKIVSEQSVLIEKNKLEKALIEAEILKTEAQAKAKFNLTIDSSLTDKVLRLKYIEALKELAKSPQTKTIILDGNADDLMKIIEGKEKTSK